MLAGARCAPDLVEHIEEAGRQDSAPRDWRSLIGVTNDRGTGATRCRRADRHAAVRRSGGFTQLQGS